jgi:hypothetical protein
MIPRLIAPAGKRPVPATKGMGAREKRTLVATTELNEFLVRDWAEVGQVFRLERTVLKKGVWHTTVVYGLTSLSPKRASPERLLELNRGHWGIENRSHWRRDVTDGGKIIRRFARAVLPKSWLLSITRCWL